MTITIMLLETTQIGMTTPDLRTEVSFTGTYFNINQSTTLENKVLSTNEKYYISQSTTLKIEVSSIEENNISQSMTTRTEILSTDQNPNISQGTATSAFSSKTDSDIQSSKHLVTYTWYLLRQNASCISILSDDRYHKSRTMHNIIHIICIYQCNRFC